MICFKNINNAELENIHKLDDIVWFKSNGANMSVKKYEKAQELEEQSFVEEVSRVDAARVFQNRYSNAKKNQPLATSYSSTSVFEEDLCSSSKESKNTDVSIGQGRMDLAFLFGLLILCVSVAFAGTTGYLNDYFGIVTVAPAFIVLLAGTCVALLHNFGFCNFYCISLARRHTHTEACPC